MVRVALVAAALAIVATSLVTLGSACVFELPGLVSDGGGGHGATASGTTTGTAGSGGTGGSSTGAPGGGTPCDERWWDCNGDPGDGCETDTWTHPHHCGFCARDCLDGDCVDGMCQPMLFDYGPHDCEITVDEEFVYSFSSNNSALLRTPKSGTAHLPIVLAPGGPLGIISIAVDDQHIYWSQSASQSLYRADKTGAASATVVVANAGEQPRHLILDGSYVYWFDDAPPASPIQRAPKGELVTAQTIVASSGMISPSAIAVDDGWLYWSSDSDTTDAIRRTAADGSGGSPQVIVPNVISYEKLRVDTSDLYFADFTNNRIARVPLGGGTVTELASTGTDSVHDLGTDTTYVYWLTSTAIHRVPKTGGVTVTLTDGLNTPCAMAVDENGSYLYFVDVSSHDLYRVAK